MFTCFFYESCLTQQNLLQNSIERISFVFFFHLIFIISHKSLKSIEVYTNLIISLLAIDIVMQQAIIKYKQRSAFSRQFSRQIFWNSLGSYSSISASLLSYCLSLLQCVKAISQSFVKRTFYSLILLYFTLYSTVCIKCKTQM